MIFFQEKALYLTSIAVASPTLNRRDNDHEIGFPSSKKSKQCHDLEEGGPNTDSTYLEKPFEPADGHEQNTSNGANLSNIAQPIGSSTSFDFVKVCYEGDVVWIEFSLTSSFDKLNESVCKKFELEVNKFQIKYIDEDNEWLLMTSVADFTHALLHTSSSGRKFVRLSIIDIGIVNTDVHLDGSNKSNIAQPNGSSSSFDFVKVCYDGDPVLIDFFRIPVSTNLISLFARRSGLR